MASPQILFFSALVTDDDLDFSPTVSTVAGRRRRRRYRTIRQWQ